MADDGLGSVISMQASAPYGLLMAGAADECGRLEALLCRTALLTPLLSVAKTYSDVHVVNAAVLGVVLMLGAVHTLLWHLAFGERGGKGAGGSGGDSGSDDSSNNRFLVATAETRFPASAVRIFIFLSHGSAVAAGIGIGEFVRFHQNDNGDEQSSHESIAPTTVVPHIIVAVLLLVAPIISILAVRFIVDIPAAKHAEAKRIASEADDDPIFVETAASAAESGESSMHPKKSPKEKPNEGHRRIETARAVDPTNGENQRWVKTIQSVHPWLFLCSEIRPTGHARRFGPAVADLRLQTALSPALPFLFPLVLLIATLITRLFCDCNTILIVISVAMLAYAVLMCVALRPFLGVMHNTVEALVAIAAAVTLFLWWSELRRSSSGGCEQPRIDDDFSFMDACGASPESLASALALCAISNCRLPFVLARVLDVCLPSVTRVVRKVRRTPFVDGDNSNDGEDEITSSSNRNKNNNNSNNTININDDFDEDNSDNETKTNNEQQLALLHDDDFAAPLLHAGTSTRRINGVDTDGGLGSYASPSISRNHLSATSSSAASSPEITPPSSRAASSDSDGSTSEIATDSVASLSTAHTTASTASLTNGSTSSGGDELESSDGEDTSSSSSNVSEEDDL